MSEHSYSSARGLACLSVLERKEGASGSDPLSVVLTDLKRIPQSGMVERTEQ
jgi:hypothetical protein